MKDKNMFSYIVIGAGFAGSVIAERIANVLGKKVLIIDKRNHIGGNCYDELDENNIIIHKYGPHLFHTSNDKVVNYISKFTKFDIYQHKVLAYVNGMYIPIPFNFKSIDMLFPQEVSTKIKSKLLETYELDQRIPILELLTNKDDTIRKFANFVYDKIFKNYTAKQWGKKPEEIDPEVTSRVPVVIGYDDRYFTDKYQYVPSNGYTEIFKNMLNHPNIKIMLNTDFREIGKLIGNDVYIFGKKYKGLLIYTGPLDELLDYKFGELKYRSLKLEFKTINKKYFQKNSVINYPNDYEFTRITEFKHIHKTKNTNKTTILVEYPKSYSPLTDIPFYPFFDKESKEAYSKYLEFISRYKNIITVGRLADYKYYDMDDIIERALEVFETKVKNFKPNTKYS